MGVLVVTVVMADLLFVHSLARLVRLLIQRGAKEALLTHRHQPPEHLLLLACS
jgi:hypothetical protein